eukprot:Pgem_evm2s3101
MMISRLICDILSAAYVYTAKENRVKAINEASAVFLSLNYATHTSSIFLLISYFNVMVSETFDKTSLMSKTEFKIYCIYSFLSIPGYFVFTYVLRFVTTRAVAVAVPQFLYTAELTISSALLVWCVMRIKSRLKFYQVSGVDDFGLKSSIVPTTKTKTKSVHTLSNLILKRIIRLTYVIVIINMVVAWSLGLLNIFKISNNFHLLPTLVIDILTAAYCYAIVLVPFTIVIILNVGKKNNLTVDPTTATTSTSARHTKNETVRKCNELAMSSQLESEIMIVDNNDNGHVSINTVYQVALDLM